MPLSLYMILIKIYEKEFACNTTTYPESEHCQLNVAESSRLLMFTKTGPCEEVVLEGSQDITLEECTPDEEVETETIGESVTQIKVIVTERIMKLKLSELPVDCYVAYVCEETGAHVISDEDGPRKFEKESTSTTIDLREVNVIYVVILVPSDQVETDLETFTSDLVAYLSVTVCGEW